VKYNAFATFWLSCPVLSFFLYLGPRSNRWTNCYGLWLKRHVSAKEVPFGVTTIDDVIWGKYAPNSSKVGVSKQFQAKIPKYQNRSMSKTVNLIKPKFEDKAETTTRTTWVGYHCPKTNTTWLTAAIIKIAMTS